MLGRPSLSNFDKQHNISFIGCSYFVPAMFGVSMIAGAIVSVVTLYKRPGKRLPGLIRLVFTIITASLSALGVLFLISGLTQLSSYLRFHYYRSVVWCCILRVLSSKRSAGVESTPNFQNRHQIFRIRCRFLH